MAITPDTKDWTWVLKRTCTECGFDVRDWPVHEVGELIRDSARQWQQVLRDPRVRQRPSDDRWSALEYGCHVRDVFRLYDVRLALMLENDAPTFQNWDQDKTAIEERYSEQDPATVARELQADAATLADRFDGVEETRWQRSGTRSDGAWFTIETFARYMIHDPMHHLHDARQGYEKIGAGSS